MLPTIRVGHYQTVPFLEFDEIEVGETAALQLRVHNASEARSTIVADTPPARSGLTLEPARLELAPGAAALVTVTWAPTKAGKECKKLTFKQLGARGSLQASVSMCATESEESRRRAAKKARAAKTEAALRPSKAAAAAKKREASQLEKMRGGGGAAWRRGAAAAPAGGSHPWARRGRGGCSATRTRACAGWKRCRGRA